MQRHSDGKNICYITTAPWYNIFNWFLSKITTNIKKIHAYNFHHKRFANIHILWCTSHLRYSSYEGIVLSNKSARWMTVLTKKNMQLCGGCSFDKRCIEWIYLISKSLKVDSTFLVQNSSIIYVINKIPKALCDSPTEPYCMLQSLIFQGIPSFDSVLALFVYPVRRDLTIHTLNLLSLDV